MEVAATHTPIVARHLFNVVSDVCDQLRWTYVVLDLVK